MNIKFLISSGVALFAIGLLLSSPAANASKLYKWVDKEGRVSYQDQPPPKGAKILEEGSTKNSSSDGASGKNTVNQSPVEVYVVDECEMCAQVLTHLRSQNIPVSELPLQDDREAQSLILERTDSLIVPTLFIGTELIQGGNLNDIDRALEQAGYQIQAADDAP